MEMLETLDSIAFLKMDERLLKYLRDKSNITKDQVIYIGTNGKMSEVSAAMGLTLLEGLDELVAAEEGMNELRSAVREAPEAELEAPHAEATPPVAEELHQENEPEPAPEPVQADPASWPPTLPTKDDDWDDNLDVSG